MIPFVVRPPISSDYWADILGIVVFQDMPQKFRPVDANATIALFESDLHALVLGPRNNHPCIVSWDIFNEHGMLLWPRLLCMLLA